MLAGGRLLSVLALPCWDRARNGKLRALAVYS
jgi:hypothetical protein